jgi:hypothetical protein
MKAPIAQAGGEAASPPGCAIIFWGGARNRKIHLKKLGFRRGSDLSMLSGVWCVVRARCQGASRKLSVNAVILCA